MLLLFDIDGTLLRRASREHAAALLQALENIHGVGANTISAHGSAAGRTDGEIARLILLDAGVSAQRIDERALDVQEECSRLYATMCPSDLSPTVVDGMPALLEWLAGIEDVELSLVTGNYETVARIKLKSAGLGHWFGHGQGGFGSDSEDRSMLPPLARRRAGEAAGLGRSWPREQTIVIGDTPRDIACAHADQVRCFAVTTGPHEASELTDADAVLSNCEELRGALESALAAPV
jgi:phosphoglycolate phosphatase-like HAD superfamily hydrolase